MTRATKAVALLLTISAVLAAPAPAATQEQGTTGATGATGASSGASGATGASSGASGATGASSGATGATGEAGKGADEESSGDYFEGAVLALLILIIGLYWLNRTLRKSRGERRVKLGEVGLDDLSISKWASRNPVPRFLLLGADGRWSTSKTLASLWTFSLLWSIGTLALSNLLGAAKGWEAFESDPVSWQYLILLGGPVAAAIGAQTLALLRSEAGTEVKTTPPEGASFSQIYTDDEGKLDLIDFQYLAFNALSIAVFLIVFIAHVDDGLPEFPGILAALTAATTAAYLARKAALRKEPTITSISPPVAAPGERVRLWGVNLTPAREPQRKRGNETERAWASVAPEIDITFDGVLALECYKATEQASDLSEAYEVRIPLGAEIKADVKVVVNSGGSYGRKSAAYKDFEIVGPRLTNVSPPLTRGGDVVEIWGTRLTHKEQQPKVFFGDIEGEVLSLEPGGDSSRYLLRVKVPEMATGTVKVKAITDSGLSTDELTLEIAPAVRILDAPQILTLGPENPKLPIKGENFLTALGNPAYAAVYLDGTPLTVEEGGWRQDEVTVSLPTEPDVLKRRGFTPKDEAELVVRNDQRRLSGPWKLKLQVAEAAEGDTPEKDEASRGGTKPQR